MRKLDVKQASGFLLAAMLAFGCTEHDPDYCEKSSDCSGGRICDVVRATCVSPDASTIPLDGSVGADAPATSDDAQLADAFGAVDAEPPVDGEPPIDGGAIGPVDAPVADAPVDARVPDAAGTCGVNSDCMNPTKAFCVGNVCVGCQSAGVNACVTPTPACDLTSGKCVGCTADSQCTVDPAKGFCVASSCTGCNAAGATGCAARTDGKTTCATTGTAVGQCVACVADAQCTADPAKGFCVANACTGCNTTGATGCSSRVDGKIVCATTGTAAGQCVQCTADSQCTADPAKGFCVANACTGCNTSGATGCAGRTDGKTVCAATGTAAGQCVQCTADSQCTADPAKGFCVANACTGCNAAGATGCTGRTDGKTTCATTGTAAGQCVQCTGDSQCTANPSKGFCVANACTGCNTTGATGCSSRSDGKNVCASSGTLAGQCVVCVSSSDCNVATSPICTSNVCGACTADSQCSAKLGTTGNPGVCLNNIDGHCATDAETVYVQNVAGTCIESGTGAGSAATPFCTARYAVTTAISTSGKDLVVMKGTLADFSIATPAKALTVVGQTATVTPGGAGADGIDITSGTVYLRNITIQSATSTGMGISAAPTSSNSVTLYLSGCKVMNNAGGGILLNGAAFDIENTAVTGNGPGNFGGLTTWGGVLVNTPPTGGPATLNLVTVQNNNQVGISCSGSITGTGVLATGNNSSTSSSNQITPSCGFTSCTAAGTGCGTQ